MPLDCTMELTRITKLLLWLLARRPDIGELDVLEPEMMDYLPDHDNIDIQALFAELTPDERRLVEIDILNNAYTKSIDDPTA
jgi:hypothetical protein